jgi:hypothetical protein
MRAKRRVLHYKKASKSKPAKLILLTTTRSQELSEGVEQEDFARLENEGGVVSKLSGRVDQAVSEITHRFFQALTQDVRKKTTK